MTGSLPAQQRFAILRSDFIDAHNAVDSAVRDRLLAAGGVPKTMLGQNIDTLSKVAANPKYSKAQKTVVDGELDRLRRLGGIRCDIVHSRMQVICVAGEDVAYFANVQDPPQYGRRGLVMTLAEMQRATKDLMAIEARLRSKDAAAAPAIKAIAA